MLAFDVPSALSKSDVEYVARLAHLELSEEERDLFTRQLADILAYAEQIAAIDTSDVPPTSHILAEGMSTRSDSMEPSLDRTETLAQAPDAAVDAGFFRVPRVLS